MRLENQVCTLEQGKKLLRFEVVGDSVFSYFGDENHVVIDPGNNEIGLPMKVGRHVWISTTEPANNQEVDHRDLTGNTKPIAPAFTVAELRVMLPDNIWCDSMRVLGGWKLYGEGDTDLMGAEVFATEAQALAEFLIFCLAMQDTTADEVNTRLLNA